MSHLDGTNRRTVLYVDDLFSSDEDFWLSHQEHKQEFEKGNRIHVYEYPPDGSFAEVVSGIKGFLQSWSGRADVLLVDMMFPDEPRGGLRILEFLQAEGIDIPLVIVVSSSEDPGLAMDLVGYPFVHRERTLDLPGLAAKFDDVFANEALCHPRKGVLITHGTDTLAYLLEVLRYGVVNAGTTNIIVTGSQVPMGQAGAASDGIDNVRSAVLLLHHLYAPQLGVVFNRGESFFRTNIQKISKWHPMAFEGVSDVTLDWDRFRPLTKDVRLRSGAHPLDELVLLRTGGTIECVEVAGKGYVPAGDFVSSFITGNLAGCFKDFRAIPFSALDSSNMTIQDWIAVLELMSERLGIEVDTRFEPRVGLLTPSPFLSADDYAAWLDRFEGIVIAGYGAGNANILLESDYSLLKAVERVAESKPVVLASQVPKEMTDFAYEVGRRFIEVGCIPAGHLSFQSCQVRLSWLLGHQGEDGAGRVDGIRRAFVDGLDFRSEGSAALYQEILAS